MSTFSVPYVFVDGTTASAGQVNANFNALIAAGNNINSVNLGGLGIYASQIVPTSAAQATFGGTIPYAFPSGLTASGTLTTIGDVTLTGLLYFGGGAGVLQQNGAENLLYSAASQTAGWRFANAGNTATLFTLSNAGDGVFTGAVTATNFEVSSASNIPVSFPNHASGASVKRTYLWPNASAAAAGVFANTFGVYDGSSATMMLAVNSQGDLGISGQGAKPGGGAWVTTSDERVKRNVRPFTDGLAQIDGLAPVEYEYNGLGGIPDTGKHYVGLIAQDAMVHAPHLVTTRRGKLAPDDAVDTDLHELDASNVTWMLLNAVKELRAQFAAYVAAHP